jgi:hypothetical protein
MGQGGDIISVISGMLLLQISSRDLINGFLIDFELRNPDRSRNIRSQLAAEVEELT